MTMKIWPNVEFAKRIMTPDMLTRALENIPDYNRTETLAEYTGKDISSSVLKSFADFAVSVKALYPDAKLTRDMKIVRDLNTDELTAIAINNLRSDMYYHPEKFPAITSSEIKED